MKRDVDLSRKILLAVEADPEADGLGLRDVEIEGRDAREVSYHIMLLHEAGLLVGRDLSDPESGLEWSASRLTDEGHNFLEKVRSEATWESLKKTAREKVGVLSLDVVKAIATKVVMDRIGGGG